MQVVSNPYQKNSLVQNLTSKNSVQKVRINYIYGFNGEPQDPELKGEGNSYDYGNRMYDPRVGKFLSLDALASKYPSISPYAFAMNSPIRSKDVGGDSVLFYSETGTYLGYSNDNQRYKGKNLLVIIKTNDVDNFREQYNKKIVGRTDNDKTNNVYTEAIVAGLEAMGTSFDVTSFESFYEQYKDKEYSNGKAVPLTGDRKTTGVEWAIDVKIDQSDSDDKGGSIAVDLSKKAYSDNKKNSVTIEAQKPGLGGFHTHAEMGNPSPSKDPDHKNADLKERGTWQMVQGSGMFSIYRDNAPYNSGDMKIIEIPVRTSGQFTKGQKGM